MLNEGCARPQEMVRRYAEQSSAQISLLQQRQHLPYARQCAGMSGVSLHHHHHRYHENCLTCLQSLNGHHHRRRRVSTPTNVKLKEWFTTINHKWARIKRQVILHHQRQQPLINEDNYGTNESISCCHVSATNKTPADSAKGKNLKDLLSACDEGHLHCSRHGQCLLGHRYANGFTDFTGYGYRRQQFGRWPEEPIFGSRYAFDLDGENRQASSVTNTPNIKTRTLLSAEQQQPPAEEEVASEPNFTSLFKSSSIDTIAALVKDPIEEIRRLHLRQADAANGEMAPSGGKTFSATRTLARIPLKSLDYCNKSKLLQRTSSFDGGSGGHCSCNCSEWLLDMGHLDDPFGPVQDEEMRPVEANGVSLDQGEAGTTNDTLSQLATIFTTTLNTATPVPNGFSPTNLLHCPANSVACEEEESASNRLSNGFQSAATLRCNGSMLSASPFSQLANLNGRVHCRPGDEKRDSHLHSDTRSQSKSMLSGTSSSGSSSSSSGVNISTGCCCSTGSGTCFCGQSQQNGHLCQQPPHHLSAHSTPLSCNSNSMEATSETGQQAQQQPTRHSSQSSPTGAASISASVAECHPATWSSSLPSGTLASGQCESTVRPNNVVLDGTNSVRSDTSPNRDSSSVAVAPTGPSLASCISGSKPPIIDLLKEFDVCFNGNDNIDDDSSTLTDNSSHSLCSPLRPKCPATTDSTGGFTDLNASLTSASNVTFHTMPAPTMPPPPPPPPPPSMSLGPVEFTESGPTGTSFKQSVCHSQRVTSQQVPLGDTRNDLPTIDNTGSQSNGTLHSSDNSPRKLKDIELICLNEEMEEVQETIKKCRRGPICFDPRCITLKRRIGNGYFGDVFLATIPSAGSTAIINLAVKMLKSHAVPQQKAEILREAQTMAKLDHRHIVRLIGVCEGDPFMLVMELAPLGPLNKYLHNYGQNMSDEEILRLMLQVAHAMQYLEEMNYVHRDLAARNILLVNEKFAKVSDFGMSRALGIGKDYYKARSASKWPLKWYAPECIYYYKFSSKSDVWSYGVALWEAMSRGVMPYQGMDGQDILRMFTENRRLPKPDNCPVAIYQLMWSCWQFKAEDRVNFASIVQQLNRHLNSEKIDA